MMFTKNQKIIGAVALGALAFVGVSLLTMKEAQADEPPVPPAPKPPVPPAPVPPAPKPSTFEAGIYKVTGQNKLPLRMHPEPDANSGVDWVTTPGLTYGVLVEADGQTQNGFAHIVRVIGATSARDGAGKSGWSDYRFLTPTKSTLV